MFCWLAQPVIATMPIPRRILMIVFMLICFSLLFQFLPLVFERSVVKPVASHKDVFVPRFTFFKLFNCFCGFKLPPEIGSSGTTSGNSVGAASLF